MRGIPCRSNFRTGFYCVKNLRKEERQRGQKELELQKACVAQLEAELAQAGKAENSRESLQVKREMAP